MTLAHKGEKMDQIVKRLMAWARKLGAHFKCAYWDKAFGVVNVMRYLGVCRAPYVIAPAKQGVRQLCVGRSSRMVRYTFNARKERSIASSARAHPIATHRTAVVVNRAGVALSQPLCPGPREMCNRHSLWLAHLSPSRDVERSGDCIACANSIATRLFAGILLSCARPR